MKFNDLFEKIMEDFRVPYDSNRIQKKQTSGKYGSINPRLNSPHSTKAISGFKGQPGGKMRTVIIKIKKRKAEDGEALDKLTSKEHPAMKAVKGKDLSSQFSPGVRNTLSNVHDKVLKDKEEDAQDRCKRKADQVYGKKTSAYKSGAIVRCRQGKIWKKK